MSVSVSCSGTNKMHLLQMCVSDSDSTLSFESRCVHCMKAHLQQEHFNTEWWLITDVVWRRRCVSVFRDPSVPCAGVIGTRVCSSPAARRCTCFAWSIAWPVFSSCVDRSSPERFTRRRTCPSSACRLASAHTCLLPSLPPSRYKTASSAPYISDLILYSNWVHHTKSRVFFQAVKMHDHNTHL